MNRPNPIIPIEPSNHIDFDALYIHVPFCSRRCGYCDFYSVVPEAPDVQRSWVQTVTRQIEAWSEALQHVRTIYVGGGTPSMLPIEMWRALGECICRHTPLNDLREFTIEANPESLTEEHVAYWVEVLGVDRLSMGAQSFDTSLLRVLDREHRPQQVVGAIAMARKAGITRLNIDLIHSIPGQDEGQLRDDLQSLIDLDVEHVSAYSLSVEPNTPLFRRVAAGQVSSPDEGEALRHYQIVHEQLCRAGLVRYEISNHARPGRWSQHNMNYWSGGSWLGVGPSAASSLGHARWRQAEDLARYAQQVLDQPHCRPDLETLTADQRIGELLMLGLRTSMGIARLWVDTHLDETRKISVEHFVQNGDMIFDATSLRLTDQGITIADTIFAELI